MRIFPAIDLKNGQCVRLKQGRFDDVTVYGSDPVAMVKDFVAAGASYIHMVDLDGARTGTGYNQDAIKRIIDTFHIPVQTGGGIRNMRDIEEKISIGVSRVIIGTAAVDNPDLVKEAVKIYGDKIAVGIDAVKTVIYTDISKDGMMIGPNIETTKELIDKTGINIIASGGVTTMTDLEKVDKIGSYGVIIGKAIYQGALNLQEVIQRFEKK